MDDSLARINDLFGLTQAQASRYQQLRSNGAMEQSASDVDEVAQMLVNTP